MIVKIGNKEVQLTDYLSANQIKKVLYETYEQGYQTGGSDMEQAKQIIIDGLLKQIEQIRADVIEEVLPLIKDIRGLCRDDVLKDLIEKVERLKEQKNE